MCIGSETHASVLSHIFHVSSADVNFICNSTDKYSFNFLMHKRIRFLKSSCFCLGQHAILHKLYMYTGKQELSLLEAISDS